MLDWILTLHCRKDPDQDWQCVVRGKLRPCALGRSDVFKYTESGGHTNSEMVFLACWKYDLTESLTMLMLHSLPMLLLFLCPFAL